VTQDRFDEYCKEYEKDTICLSRTKYTHPAFYELHSDRTDTIVPLLLIRVRDDVGVPWYIFELLYLHTSAKPYFDDGTENRHQETRESWLRWGKENKYID
jgi:hypothetical protein